MQFPHLFSPITINGMTLKNRAVMPPMGTGYGNSDNTVSDRLVASGINLPASTFQTVVEIC